MSDDCLSCNVDLIPLVPEEDIDACDTCPIRGKCVVDNSQECNSISCDICSCDICIGVRT